MKKKDNNTINYDGNINEEDLLKNKITKKLTKDEEKLISGIKKINISTELKSTDNIKESILKNTDLNVSDNINYKKLNTNKITNNKIKTFTKSDNDKRDNAINDDSNLNESNEEAIKQNEIENIKKIEEIKNKKNKSEIILLNSDFNEQIIEEEEKINKYADYLNNPKPESNKPSTIPGEAKLNPEYDLYYCGKPNHIDCICCIEHKCKPGACMCISCMKLNKKYHKLKSHYLINKSGRACKYSHGYFHCYCNYTHIVYDVGNNIFKPIYKCQGENICKPCEEITLLMETYLPNTICQKLRERETKQTQF